MGGLCQLCATSAALSCQSCQSGHIDVSEKNETPDIVCHGLHVGRLPNGEMAVTATGVFSDAGMAHGSGSTNNNLDKTMTDS